VYIQLHKLSDRPLASFQEAFLASEELAAIWRELTDPGSRAGWTLRLYLDGLDEVPNQARQVEIANIAASGVSPKVQIIMTARDYVSGPWLSWLRRLEIQAFNEHEVRQLTEKWLDGDASGVSTFYQRLKRVSSLGALMKVPLLATLILAVYKHGHEGLPESRPRLYEMFVRLLAGGWDAAKNINRGSKFQSSTKLAVLSHLAGMLHGEKRRDCTADDVYSAIRERVSGLQIKTKEVLSELVIDGLLIPTGSFLSFPHLSFQEFLAAKDLVGLDPDRASLKLDAFLRGDDWWREVLIFYVSFHDRPVEMEEWIKSGVGRALPKKSEEVVRSRAFDLCRVILTKFPSYRFSTDTLQLIGRSSESAFKVGQARKSSATRPRTVSG
jgi:predicted NACHT family NTPase